MRNGSARLRLMPAVARRTLNPSPSRNDGASTTSTTGRVGSPSAGSTRGRIVASAGVSAGIGSPPSVWTPPRTARSGSLFPALATPARVSADQTDVDQDTDDDDERARGGDAAGRGRQVVPSDGVRDRRRGSDEEAERRPEPA